MRNILFSLTCLVLLIVAGCSSPPPPSLAEQKQKGVTDFLVSMVKERLGTTTDFVVLSESFMEEPRRVSVSITYSYKDALGLENKRDAHMELCPRIDFAEKVVPGMLKQDRKRLLRFQDDQGNEFPYKALAVSSLKIGTDTFSTKELEVLTSGLKTLDFPKKPFELFTRDHNTFVLMRQRVEGARLISERMGMLEEWMESRKSILGDFSYTVLEDQSTSGITNIVLTEVNPQMAQMDPLDIVRGLCPGEKHAFWDDGLSSSFIFVRAGEKKLGSCRQAHRPRF